MNYETEAKDYPTNPDAQNAARIERAREWALKNVRGFDMRADTKAAAGMLAMLADFAAQETTLLTAEVEALKAENERLWEVIADAEVSLRMEREGMAASILGEALTKG